MTVATADRTPPVSIRLDRRTFLKAMGLAGIGLAASPLGWWPRGAPVADGAVSDHIGALAFEHEFDLERLFGFVSERVRYEPYAGVLRGAHGTLMGGAGNSADQAVLLAALLQASGIPHRFAIGPLPPEAAARLLASATSSLEDAQRQTLDALAGRAPGGRPLPPIERGGETDARIDEARARADAVVAWAQDQLDTAVETIETALADTDLRVPTGYSHLPVLERDRHVWLQAAFGPEWLDLDPTIRDAAPGDTAATASDTVDAIPDELRHRVRFRVVAESVAQAGLREEVLLDVDEFADVLAGEPIGLVNIEREGLKAIGANIVGGLEGGTTYLPCLIAGDLVVVGPGVIRFGGDPSADPFAGGAGSPTEAADGEPVSEWLEVTIESPGAEPVVVRRPVFDRIGPAVRRNGDFERSSLSPAALVKIEPSAPPDYLPAQTSHWLTIHTGLVGGEALGQALQPVDTTSALPAPVHAYHVAREVAGSAIAVPNGTRVFADGPNIVSLTLGQDLVGDSGLILRTSLDIWHRSLGSLPVAGASASIGAPMTAGIVAHIAERLMLGDPLRGPAQGGPLPSVGAVFDAARSAGIPTRLVASVADVERLPFDPDVVARLAETISLGWVAIVPARPVVLGGEERVGWWLIDPTSGRVSDGSDRGIAGMTDQALILGQDLPASVPLRRLAVCVATLSLLATVPLTIAIGPFAASVEQGNVPLAVASAMLAGIAGGAAGVVGEELALAACS